MYELIHNLIIESVSGGFWKFIGYLLMSSLFFITPLKFIMFLINRPMRHWNINKHGYPPQHCDADGDFKQEDE